MTQRWSPPGYPEEPYYEEPGYYREEAFDSWGGDSYLQRMFPFATGSCLTLIVCLCAFGCFVFFWTGAWFTGDAVLQALGGDGQSAVLEPTESPRGPEPPFAEQSPFVESTPAPPEEPGPPPAPTPQPPPAEDTSAQDGASQDRAARIDQPLVDSEGLEITVLDVRRDLSLEIPVGQDKEFLSVSLRLRSLRPPGETNAYDILDFLLIGDKQVFYEPDPVADNGRRLAAGEITGGMVIDGDLIFQVFEDEEGFFLVWNSDGPVSPLWFNLAQ